MFNVLIYNFCSILLLSYDQNVYCKITEEKLSNLININLKFLY